MEQNSLVAQKNSRDRAKEPSYGAKQHDSTAKEPFDRAKELSTGAKQPSMPLRKDAKWRWVCVAAPLYAACHCKRALW